MKYIHAGEPVSTSDHASIVYGMKCHSHHSTEHVPWLNFKGADYTAINTFLMSLDWSEIYRDCTCAEDYYLAFKRIICIVINNFVPLVDQGESARRDVPWFNVKLKRLLRAKQRRWRSYCLNGNLVTHACYRESAKDFKSAFLKAKCAYEKHIFIFLARSLPVPRNFIVMYVTTPSVNQVLHPVLENDNILTTDTEKANAFANYFTTVFVEDTQTLRGV